MSNLYLDLNVLQTVPSSNINRDDTGSPKTALYGGVTRARVSSQSWKRAIRQAFNAENPNTGIRTTTAPKLLADRLEALDSTLGADAAVKKAADIFNAAGISLNKDNETKALLLVSEGQLKKLAQYATDHEDLDKKELKKVLKGDQSLDLALFGRMVADNPELNVEAASQVAHAISTHEIVPEFDYFTALDDKQSQDTSGAAMLGTIEFDSSTLYRYANINMNELRDNIGTKAAIQGAAAFIKAFVLSMPTGKQNTFANKTLPNYVMVTVRRDTPVNLVSAFEEPVTSKNGYVAESVKRIEAEYQSTLQFVEAPTTNLVLSKYPSQAGEKVSDLSELVDKITEALSEAVSNENDHD